MDATTVAAIFPYALAGVGILGSAVIALCGWFIKRLLDDNTGLKNRLSEHEKSSNERYERLQEDNTRIKVELEHVHAQLDITVSEFHALDINNNLEHAEFYDRLLKAELSHATLLTQHNCYAKEKHG